LLTGGREDRGANWATVLAIAEALRVSLVVLSKRVEGLAS